MTIQIIKCGTAEDAQAILQGVVRTKKINAGLSGLVGKTLIFAQPTAVTVTFVAGADSQGFLTFAEIAAQLTAGVAQLTIGQREGALLLRSTNADGVSITGGTARTALGFQADGTTTGLVYNKPGGVAPDLISVYYAEGCHVLVLEIP